MIPNVSQSDPTKVQSDSKVNPKWIKNYSKMIATLGLGMSDKGRKRVGLFLKGSSVSYCVLAEHLFSSLDLVQSSWPCLVELAKFSRDPKFSVQFWSLLFSSKVYCSVPKSSAQFQSLLFSSKVFCSVPKSSVQLQSLLCSSKVFCSVPKSSVQFRRLLFSSKVFCAVLKSSLPGWSLTCRGQVFYDLQARI